MIILHVKIADDLLGQTEMCWILHNCICIEKINLCACNTFIWFVNMWHTMCLNISSANYQQKFRKASYCYHLSMLYCVIL